VDVGAGEVRARFPFRGRITVLPEGVLYSSGARLSRYGIDRKKPVWTQKRHILHGHPRLVGDGTRIAVPIHLPKGGSGIEILDAADGRTLGRLDFPHGQESWIQVLGANEGGTALLLGRSTKEMRLVQLEDESEVFRVRLPEGRTLGRAWPLAGGVWLVDGDPVVWLLSPEGRLTASIPFRQIRRVARLDDRRLLASSWRCEAVLDLAGARVVWESDTPGWSAPAFGNRLVVRPLADAAGAELIHPASGAVVLTVRAVAARKGLGWVASSPDGRWDAAPEALSEVSVYRDDRLLGRGGEAPRRTPDLVRAILAGMLGK
jgi:hypothetical protein